MVNLLQFQPVKQFIDVVGKDVEKYFGEDDACIVYLQPDGVFYGRALYEWLKRRKQNIVLLTMEDDGKGLDEEKVKGRKVLIVDNDIVTGKGYKRSVETFRIRKKELGIRDVKFAAFSDRVGLADFSAAKYSAEAIWHLDELDAIDLKIIHDLSQNGRVSFADIGGKTRLSSVAVKNRVDKLLKEKIIRIEATLNMDQFYTMCAQIHIEADSETVEHLIEKFAKRQEVYHLVRVTGLYNLLVGIAAHNWQNIADFIEKEIRALPGVKKIFIITGEAPILPKAVPLKF